MGAKYIVYGMHISHISRTCTLNHPKTEGNLIMTDKNRAIGVFDSGVGGLTAVKELVKLLPCEDIIYLGDTARVPYGTKSRETIEKYAKQDFDFLKKFGVKMIISACGTVSSVLASGFDFGEGLYTGVIVPAVDAAIAATSNRR